MYLYTLKQDEVSKVPEPLMAIFGQAKLVITMLVTPEKKLGRAETADVIAGLQDKGFYLQMPIVEDDEMKGIAEKNSKLPRS
jgi:uncharacterized protein YcgL (UPF0745 family)